MMVSPREAARVVVEFRGLRAGGDFATLNSVGVFTQPGFPAPDPGPIPHCVTRKLAASLGRCNGLSLPPEFQHQIRGTTSARPLRQNPGYPSPARLFRASFQTPSSGGASKSPTRTQRAGHAPGADRGAQGGACEAAAPATGRHRLERALHRRRRGHLQARLCARLRGDRIKAPRFGVSVGSRRFGHVDRSRTSAPGTMPRAGTGHCHRAHYPASLHAVVAPRWPNVPTTRSRALPHPR